MIYPYHEVWEIIKKNENNHYQQALMLGMIDGELDVDYEYFVELSKVGRCIVYIDKLSYAMFSISEKPLQKKRLIAFNEVFYVHDRRTSKEFIQKACHVIKSFGVDEICFVVPNKKVGRFLGMCGLKNSNQVWSY